MIDKLNHHGPSQILNNFSPATLQQSINFLTYGQPIIKKYKQKGKSWHNTIFFLHEDDFSILQWISPKKSYADSRVYLKNVTTITDQPAQNVLKKVKSQNILVLTIGETGFLALDFPTANSKDLWWQGIQHFWVLSRNEKKENHLLSLSHTLFLKFDKDGTKYLDKNEIKALLNEMHISVNEGWFEKTFMEFDRNKNNQIEYEEFKQMLIKISLKQEAIPLFEAFCLRAKEGIEDVEMNVMTEEEIQKFFLKEQNQKLDIVKDIRPLIDYYNDNEGKAAENKETNLSFLNFCNIIFSMSNQIFNKEKFKIFQDMDHPLTDYWINSSHNTYLVANQLTGESSTQAYINAFQKGCRCVELDCWDGDKGEPIVYHGHTLTSKILFEDVIKIIKDYAFIKNPYPVILSIENHCSKKLQDRMAEIMENIFGDALYRLPEDWEEREFFPSPNELKHKILIKDKAKLVSKNENFQDEQEENVAVEEPFENHHMNFKTMETLSQAHYLKQYSIEPLKFDSEFKFNEIEKDKAKSDFTQKYGYQLKNLNEIEEQIMKNAKPKASTVDNLSKNNKILDPISEKFSPDTDRKNTSGTKKKKSTAAVEKSEKLKGLIAIFGTKFVMNDKSRFCWNISSLSEDKVIKNLQANEIEFINHNKWTFTRTYPGGLRIDSSNYDPMPAFISGSQVIALNFQTNDLNLQIYLSKFMMNGGVNCGYLLKPEYMLSTSKSPKYPKDFTKPLCQINVKIISGVQLKPMKKDESDIIDPFVEVSLKGLPIEEKSNKLVRTNTINNNGFNPRFGGNYSFQVYCPEIAVLVFQVFDEDKMSNEFIGSYAIPVECIRTGYRVVPLKNTIGFEYIENSFIFCHIEKILL